MHNPSKTYQELIEENSLLKQRLRELEQSLLMLKITDERASQEKDGNDQSIPTSPTEGIFHISADGRLLVANSALAHLLGYESIEDLFASVTNIEKLLFVAQETYSEYIRLVFEKKTVKAFETKAYRKDGSILWLSINSRLISDDLGNPTYIDGFVSDITENRKLRDELYAVMREQRIILDTANVGISLIRDRKQVWINRKTEEMFQYSKEELINQTTRKLYPSQEAYEQLGAAAYPILAQGMTYETVQELVRRDGSHIWVRYNGRAIDPHDLSHGTLWILEDITERKGIEEKLQRAYDELELRVADRTEALTLVNEELRTEIAERKQAEEALQGSEERYRLLVETANEGIWSMDGDHVTTFVNEAMANMLGYEPSEMLGKKVEEFFFPEDMPFHEERMRIRHGGEDAVYERRFRRRDGKPLWTIVSAKVIKDGTGHFIGSFAMFTDITDRKKAEETLQAKNEEYEAVNEELRSSVEELQAATEELQAQNEEIQQTDIALRESEEKLRNLFMNSRDGIVMVDDQGHFLNANPAYCAMLGFSVKELRDLNNFYSITPEKWQAWERDEIWNKQIMLQGYSGIYEKEYVRKNGTVFPVELQAFAVFDPLGKVDYIWGVARDITDRKRTEEELRFQSEIMINIVEAIYLVRMDDGIIVYTNSIFERMFGYEQDEMLGKPVSIVNAPSEKKPEETAKEIMSEINDTGSWKGEVNNRKKDGTTFWCYANVSVFDHSKFGRVLVAIHTDITDRKQAEKDILEQRNLSQKYLQIAGVMIVALNVAGEVTLINRKGLDILGYQDEQELVGKNWFDVILPKNVVAGVKLVFDQLMSGNIQPVEYYENTVLNRNGEERIVAFHNTVLRYEDGKPSGILSSGEDITDRRKAEDTLSKAQQLAHIGSWELDLSTNHLIWSDEIYRIFGLQPQEFCATYEAFLDAIHPDDRTAVDAAYSSSLREGKDNYEIEHRVIRKNTGEVRDVLERCEHMRDASGKIIRSLGMVQDITSHKLAEEALRESSRRQDEIIENLPDATFVIDRDGRVIAWNKAIEQMTGILKEEIIGKGNYEYAIPFYGERRPIIVDLAFLPNEEFEKRKYDDVHRIADRLYGEVYVPKTYGGKGAYLSATASKLHDASGNTIGAIESIRDLTERKLAEEALQTNEARLRAVFDSVQDFIFIKDTNRRYIIINNYFQRRFQIDPSVFLGHTDAEIPIFENRDMTSEIIQDTDALVLQGETAHYELTHRVCGTLLTFDILKTPIRDGQGNVTTICGVSRDTTDRKQAEVERSELEERLNRAEKMESLGTLAGGVAHDLNNVLGIVVGYAEMLMDELDESNPMRNDLEKILEGGNRSAAIVQDLLTLARRGVQTKKTVNLNATIMDCHKLPEFEKVFSYNLHVKIKTDLEADLLNIMGSPVHLAKTIINLASNAVEAMPNGGVLKIATTNQYLDMPIHGYDHVREGDYVVLTVSDTGEGIPERDIKRIFEPFYTKKIMGRSGTGLGLAVVWGTIKDHNGYINVESTEGKGTTFTLYLPVTREEMEREQISVSMSEYMGRGETILIVDDVNRQRELASRMLTKLNYSVSTVASGEEAIEYLKTNKADLIVLDMIMDPGIDGLETYEKILEINLVQRAVIVSGFSESDRVKEAQKIGAGAYVPKPYVLERLGMAVRKELDRK